MSEDNKMFCCSIKQSKKRGMWQIKGANHELVALLGMHPLIHQVLPKFNIDREDRSSLLKLCLSASSFPESQIELSLVTDPNVLQTRKFKSGQGPLYQVSGGGWPEVSGICEIPRALTEKFGSHPDVLYLSFERTEFARFM